MKNMNLYSSEDKDASESLGQGKRPATLSDLLCLPLFSSGNQRPK